jgi:hypothetical protein
MSFGQKYVITTKVLNKDNRVVVVDSMDMSEKISSYHLFTKSLE